MNLRASIAALPEKGAYAAAWRRLKAMPAGALVRDQYGMRPAGEILAEFRRALQRRVNLRGGLEAANDPMPIELVRDARRLEDIKVRRIRVYQFESKVCRERFANLLAERGE
jgi:hypothetical protein